MKNCLLLLLLGCWLLGRPDRALGQAGSIYNILSYGAVADSTANNQAAIQRTIEACAKAGGGRVLVPAGHYGTATVRLRSRVELYLGSGAYLHALPDSALYTNAKAGLEDAGDSFIPGLIVAQHVSDISLTGPGAVVGAPRFYQVPVASPDAYPGWNENARRAGVPLLALRVRNPKVSLVYISDCQRVTLRDVRLINSPNWTCHLQWSQDVTIQGLRISSSLEKGVNSDGLDIDGCKRVAVTGCLIRTGDDAICLKTTRQGGRSETCEDITVSGCLLSSTSCALKIGTETNADIRRILFTNCTISATNRGLGIIVRDGATVAQVVFSNIVLDCQRRPFFWWGNGEAFHFNVLRRNPNSKVGRIEDVRLTGVAGTVEGTSAILGLPGAGDAAYSSIRDVQLADIRLRVRPESEPDKRLSHGIDIRNAEGVRLRNVAVTWEQGAGERADQHGLYLRAVRDFTVTDFANQPAPTAPNQVAVLLDNAQNGQLTLPATGPTTGTYAEVAGAQSQRLRFRTDGKSRREQVRVSREARRQTSFQP